MAEMLRSQIGKSAGIYRFSLAGISSPDGLPFMTASALNGIRRELASRLDAVPCNKKDILLREIRKEGRKVLSQKNVSYKSNVSNRLSSEVHLSSGAESVEQAYELTHVKGAELMRTRYCIRHELGLCPIHQKAAKTGPLFLLNNGRRLALHFDCSRCEMTVTED